ncbi:N-acetylmuramoyl-L-alanine amidase [Paenibacillus turicensis]|uniref:N-acetylmuramoyl-L-alanine amidase n=2 Tax=Paenibacillus turicensis TaxID=160487 RepID=A0ABS4FTZ5_9BACL|nr:N-acetylmuramoyl-L-alanine amidase [Paenibacillus turicensis]
MMKKTVYLLLFSFLLVMLFPFDHSAAAEAPRQTKIILDGKELALAKNTEVTNIKGNVMVPLRIVVENLKYKVEWEPKTKGIVIKNEDKTIALTVNQQQAVVNKKEVLLNVAPIIQNQSTIVPLRFVGEQMGLDVKWDNSNKIVRLAQLEKEAPSDSETKPGSSTSSNSTQNKPPVVKVNHIKKVELIQNELHVAWDGDVKPTVSKIGNPERIIVDLPNTTYSDTFGNDHPLDASLKGALNITDPTTVTGVRYALFTQSPDQVRVVLDLTEATPYTVTQDAKSQQLIVKLDDSNLSQGSKPTEPTNTEPTTPTTPSTDPTQTPVTPTIPDYSNDGRNIVVIDPGHGGKDPGTSGISNTQEKDFTLAVGLKVQALLLQEPNIELYMTRVDDTYPTRPERVKLANDLQADVFVSIHGNSVLESPNANGTETYWYKRENSKQLATILHKHLLQQMGLKDRRVKEQSFEVIRETKMAASLVEVGFLSNLSDESFMFTEDGQNRAAQAIVDGIKEYLGLL